MRGRQFLLDEASRVEEIRDTGNRAIHGDLMIALEVLLDMRDLLEKMEKNT